MTVAALFVQKNGCYFGLPDVDPWDESRDARTYAGPHRVVCHPPCARWGRYWYGSPTSKRYILGDDGGCFIAALAAVIEWCGVLEHPEGSHAWRKFGIAHPPRGGGWIPAGDGFGWTCCVEQGHYGHVARKATWLYAVGMEPPDLIWGSSEAVVAGRRTTSARVGQKERTGVELLSRRQRSATPLPFRDTLLRIARMAGSR